MCHLIQRPRNRPIPSPPRRVSGVASRQGIVTMHAGGMSVPRQGAFEQVWTPLFPGGDMWEAH